MDEKKPLDSRSLTHTSKEPEAQVWAQIGTSSYDPPIEPTVSREEASNVQEIPFSGSSKFPVDKNAEEKTQEGKSLENNSEELERSRSRSRSRERGHNEDGEEKEGSLGYTTSSNNLVDIRSRVFVGHLHTKECTKEDVLELFKPFGTVLGVNLRNGYGFVQFSEEMSVRDAIKQLHGTKFFGHKIGNL